MEKYNKIKVVGRGAYGTVYLCKRLSDRSDVIIKQIPVEQMTTEQRVSALNEVIVLSVLNHPNIVHYFENFLEDKALMIVMEYAEGGTVFDYLQQRGGELLSEQEIMRFFIQILLALQHMHSKQILHRDLKTQNLLLDHKKEVVKVTDFGISRILSKSKALSVVGTPCYISPELCESQPYNQKSDIWALGCILYELATLNRAFEAQSLPALILKIMRGLVEPIATSYSNDLKSLIAEMLQIDPSKRPSVNQILATPICLKYLVSHYCNFGALTNINLKSSHHKREAHVSKVSRKSRALTLIYAWGLNNSWHPQLLPLPHQDMQVVQVSMGRTQKAAVTKNGRLFLWEASHQTNLLSPMEGDSFFSSPSSSSSSSSFNSSLFIPRFLEGQAAVSIKSVSCGDMFASCLTERGILMTFGCGTAGCLGHGNYADCLQAKIVEALLGYEVIDSSAGSSHLIVLTSDNDVFCWGNGDDGRLGLGNHDTYCSPQQVPLPPDLSLKSVHAGVDSSLVVTKKGSLLVTGSNRHNKLGLNSFKEDELCTHQLFSSYSSSSSSDSETFISQVDIFTSVSSFPLSLFSISSASLGLSHTSIITAEGLCWSFGSNRFGQLGISKTFPSLHGCAQIYFVSKHSPCLDFPKVQLITCGDAFSVAALEDGSLWSWGKSSRGRLGRSDSYDSCFTLDSSPLSASDGDGFLQSYLENINRPKPVILNLKEKNTINFDKHENNDKNDNIDKINNIQKNNQASEVVSLSSNCGSTLVALRMK